MTPLQKRCQELLPVIQAGAEGKVIQMVSVDGPRDLGVGPGCVAINFVVPNTYRIKPDPQYRPFTPEEALKHCDKMITHKEDGRVRFIKSVSCDGNRPITWMSPSQGFGSGDSWTTLSGLCKEFVFADGTPCGILVEDGQ